MKTFPILFSKTETGAIQQWQIAVFDNVIQTIHGQVDGKLQTTTDVVHEGKNPGKANATTPSQQAEKEAKAKWTKQLKKGYVENIEDAKAGKVDETVILGGIEPMLAPSKIYPTFANKLTFAVMVDPKIDGSRMIAIVKDGKCSLWSRTRKRINSLPHIQGALESQFPVGSYIFDGEAYVHSMNEDFEGLMSLIRKDYPGEGHEVIQYHIYDLPSCQENFFKRHDILMLLKFNLPLVRMARSVAHNHEEIMACHEKNLENGYEGSMVRNDGPYEFGKRSFHLQKLKNMVDSEYSIIGMEEGRGKDAGTVGAFVCKTEDGKQFKARLKATYARRTELFQHPKQWEDKMLTVTYQNLTADGIPRFPIGKSIRDYE
jgi:DNA ligase 1